MLIQFYFYNVMPCSTHIEIITPICAAIMIDRAYYNCVNIAEQSTATIVLI